MQRTASQGYSAGSTRWRHGAPPADLGAFERRAMSTA
jgi:hypothetical protein